jgi:ParB family chromosome partitioning protein
MANALDSYGNKHRSAALADMFKSTDPDRQKKDSDIFFLPLEKMVSFKEHPFKAYSEEKLAEMAESIKANGVLSPIIVRKLDDEHYEIIAGHNRVKAARLAELSDIPAVIREVDDDTATLMMIESNLNQREHILPSERGQAYKLQLETMNHQGKRPNSTLYQNGTRSDSLQKIADGNNDSRTQVTRFIRLTSLIPDLSDMVDEGKLNFTFGVDLSYLTAAHQQTVYELIQDKRHKLTAANVGKLKEAAKAETLTDDEIEEIIAVAKPKPKPPSIHKKVDKMVKQYNLPPERAGAIIQKALEMYVQTEEYIQLTGNRLQITD